MIKNQRVHAWKKPCVVVTSSKRKKWSPQKWKDLPITPESIQVLGTESSGSHSQRFHLCLCLHRNLGSRQVRVVWRIFNSFDQGRKHAWSKNVAKAYFWTHFYHASSAQTKMQVLFLLYSGGLFTISCLTVMFRHYYFLNTGKTPCGLYSETKKKEIPPYFCHH